MVNKKHFGIQKTTFLGPVFSKVTSNRYVKMQRPYTY